MSLNNPSLDSSFQPGGHGELVMCIPKGGLNEFIVMNIFPVQLEYDIMTFFTDTSTFGIYKPGGDVSLVASAEESFGFSESDIWTAHELSAYNTEVLFKRGLAKMAVAAISYKISHLIGEVATTSKTHKKERKMLRKSIVQLSVKRKNAMNYLRSRMEKFSSVSKSFVQQDLILRIVANCFDEFLSDVPHPGYPRKDFNEVHKRCLAILSSHTDDVVLLQEILAPPGNKRNDITLAFTINEIFLSGNM